MRKANMSRKERRAPAANSDQQRLRSGLTPEQIATIQTLEHFRWTLRFVRRPLFREPVPVMVHPDGERLAAIEADGSINEHSGIELRK
jgi:hypothetical protein